MARFRVGDRVRVCNDWHAGDENAIADYRNATGTVVATASYSDDIYTIAWDRGLPDGGTWTERWLTTTPPIPDLTDPDTVEHWLAEE